MVYTITSGVKSEVTDKGSVWRELLIAFVASIPFFTHGIETTSLTSSDHSGHFISSDGVPWTTTAMVLSTAASIPLFCFIVDKFGRRICLFVISLVQGASLIPLFLSNNTNIIILHVLAGVASGGLFTTIPIYIREISDRTRGFTIPLLMVMTTAGYVMKLVMELELMIYLMMGLVAFQFLSLLLLLESPCYLVMVGKFETAKVNIAKLANLEIDSPYVASELAHLKNVSEKTKAKGTLSGTTIYRNKIWWDSFKIGIVLYTIMVLSGSIVFLDQDKTLMQLRVNIDPEKTLVLYCLLAGSAFTVVFSMFFDRKYLLTLGFFIMVLSTGILAVFTQADLTINSLRWLPVASLGALIFGYGMSWGLPLVIMVEILNFEVRATLIGLIFFYSQVIKLAHIHTFRFIEDYVGIYTLFYIFASINICGVVYTLFAVPTIRNKNVKQIEKQIKRIPLPA